jgi:hypothetical protein
MKILLSIFLFLPFISLCQGNPRVSENLCYKNEALIFSFHTSNGNKVVSLIKEKNGKYLVYRFGTKVKLELEYPNKLDTTSWKAFTLNGYKRFGGKANDALTDYTISFTNKGVTYELYESSKDEGNFNEIGVKVTINGKQTNIKGNNKTKIGSLLRLDNESMIHNTVYD